jgi:hypothetical protein
MWPLSSPEPIAEHEASDELDEIYHDIRQTLRVTGINLVFRALAPYSKALPTIWHEVAPLASKQSFEEASDKLRSKAVQAAASLGALAVRDAVRAGPSQSYQIEEALRLYHYINPKLLLLVAVLRLMIEDRLSAADRSTTSRSQDSMPRGEPRGMYPMEMIAEEPDEERIAALFREIKAHYSLASINSDYRTLALWPDYLAAAWERLKAKSVTSTYSQAVQGLQAEARAQAQTLPLPAGLATGAFDRRTPDAGAVRDKLAEFERVLPPLMLNIALMALEWQPAGSLVHSPFPVEEGRHD